ncbi:dirigent protein 24-like [Cornus florida]|uniref:dirigent protein 24-like n=1 Tax=Cornus florida TaxID=4283 RepID=UPI00289D2B99|nr:dirigent protein 24-like [Cornus florida]
MRPCTNSIPSTPTLIAYCSNYLYTFRLHSNLQQDHHLTADLLTSLLNAPLHKTKMPKTPVLISKTLKATIYLLLLAITLKCANSARILDEVEPQPPIEADAPDASDPMATDVSDVTPVVNPATPLPSGQIPANAGAVAPVAGPSTTSPSGPAPVVLPSTTVAPTADVPDAVTTAPVATPTTTSAGGTATVATSSAAVTPTVDVPDTVAAPAAAVVPVATPAAASAGGTATVAAASANPDPQHPALSFFMHDILGGSHPSGKVVTGIVANSDLNGTPFSKPSSQVLPTNGGVPLVNGANGIINSNNAPFLIGLNGSPTSIQNNGNNNVPVGGNLPFVTAGQLPAGTTLQQIIFGSITVVDNELTEGHELGSSVLGKAQGFYLSSSLDGSSHTIILTALFHGGDHEVDDTISFFGVHRTASHVSHLVVIGGTGKYENSKGHATIETIRHEDQHTTDGVETITQFNVYLTL